MRITMNSWLLASTLVALVFATAYPVAAGYGSGGGSSGGYSAGYGSGGGSSGGYSAGYGSSGGYYGASAGGGSAGGNVGPLRRLHARIHDHHSAKVARRSAYYGGGGSSGGAYANYGSSGGGYGSSGGGARVGYVVRSAGSSGGGGSSGGAYYGSGYSTGGSSGNFAPSYGGGSTGSYMSGARNGSARGYGEYDSYSSARPFRNGGRNSGFDFADYSTSSDSNSLTANSLAYSQAIQPNEVHLTVNLPESAKVYVNGNPTSSVGSKRHFVSRDLNANESYHFDVKAVMTNEDGSEVVQNKTVVVESGRAEELNFAMLKASDSIETILTLNVPEKAQVVLAQNSTRSEGSSRVYRTKQLQEGEAWDDYKVEVTYEGVTKEKTIRLIGGDKLEITFNFQNDGNIDKVATN